MAIEGDNNVDIVSSLGDVKLQTLGSGAAAIVDVQGAQGVDIRSSSGNVVVEAGVTSQPGVYTGTIDVQGANIVATGTSAVTIESSSGNVSMTAAEEFSIHGEGGGSNPSVSVSGDQGVEMSSVGGNVSVAAASGSATGGGGALLFCL